MGCSHDQKFFLNDVQVGKRGQIVIPKNIRDAFGFEPGDHLVLIGEYNKGIGIMKPDQARQMAQLFMGSMNSVKKAKKEKK